MVALSPHFVHHRLGATSCFRLPLHLRRGSTSWQLGFFRHLLGVDGSSWGFLGFRLLYRRLHMFYHVANGGLRRPSGSLVLVLYVFSFPRCIGADMVAVVVGRGKQLVAPRRWWTKWGDKETTFQHTENKPQPTVLQLLRILC